MTYESLGIVDKSSETESQEPYEDTASFSVHEESPLGIKESPIQIPDVIQSREKATKENAPNAAVPDLFDEFSSLSSDLTEGKLDNRRLSNDHTNDQESLALSDWSVSKSTDESPLDDRTTDDNIK